MEDPVVARTPPTGYRIRSLTRELDERLRYIDALQAIFPHYRQHWVNAYPSHTPEQRREIAVRSTCPRMEAPQHRPELDLCIETADGTLACVCTFWLDGVCGLSIIEPMGTHPDHRRRGLAESIMLEGMRRSRELGARLVITTSYTDPAHRAYESVGLEATEAVDLWHRQF
jgi:GNAT superfamily N-acetyltransferase